MFVRDWKTNPFLTHGATLNTTVKPATRKDTECLRRMKPIRKEDACGACGQWSPAFTLPLRLRAGISASLRNARKNPNQTVFIEEIRTVPS